LLRIELQRRGLSVNEATRQLGFQPGAVSMLLSEQRGAGLKRSLRVQEVFGIDPSAWREPATESPE
jgi:plasmid maintenance system antidote protein VapI